MFRVMQGIWRKQTAPKLWWLFKKPHGAIPQTPCHLHQDRQPASCFSFPRCVFRYLLQRCRTDHPHSRQTSRTNSPLRLITPSLEPSVLWCKRIQPLRHHLTTFKIRNRQRVVCFLLGDSPESEFYVPTFRNTLFRLRRRCQLTPPMTMEQIIFVL